MPGAVAPRRAVYVRPAESGGAAVTVAILRDRGGIYALLDAPGAPCDLVRVVRTPSGPAPQWPRGTVPDPALEAQVVGAFDLFVRTEHD